jgi:hypothetical protein
MLEGTQTLIDRQARRSHLLLQVTKKRKWVTLPLAFLLITIFIANIYLVSANVRIFVLVNLPGVGYCPKYGLQTRKAE